MLAIAVAPPGLVLHPSPQVGPLEGELGAGAAAVGIGCAVGAGAAEVGTGTEVGMATGCGVPPPPMMTGGGAVGAGVAVPAGAGAGALAICCPGIGSWTTITGRGADGLLAEAGISSVMVWQDAVKRPANSKATAARDWLMRPPKLTKDIRHSHRSWHPVKIFID
jgi:hypothetical protein